MGQPERIKNTHWIKCIAPYFQHVLDGIKTFEVRRNDRDYQVGDTLILIEYVNGFPTSRKVIAPIIYKLDGGVFGINEHYCVLGVDLIHKQVKRHA